MSLNYEPSHLSRYLHSFTLQGSGFRVQGSGSRVHGSGFRVQGAGFRVQVAGCRVQGAGCRVQGLVFAVSSFLPEKNRSYMQCYNRYTSIP